MKKFSILVTLLLIVGMLTVSAFAAQTATVTVSTSSTTIHNGDTFTVTVDVSSVENCIAGGFMFNYNTDVFEYVSGSALVEGFTAADISTAAGNLAGFFMSEKANTVQGSIFQITLKVKDNAALGNYTISGTANLVSKVAGVEEAVSCTVNAATITVADGLDIRGVSRSKNLALEGTILVYANVAFMDSAATKNAEGLTKEYVMENGRLLFWSMDDMPADADAALIGTETHCAEFDKTSVYGGIQEYYAYSHGIPAKEYNDTIYYRTYIVVDGEEYYGDIIEYSVVTYCENQLKKTTDKANKMKPLLAAMLNYGAAAQVQLKYKTDALANTCLQKYVDQNLLDAKCLTLNWNDSYITALNEPDAAMTVNFAVNEAKRTSKNLGLEGAVETKLTFAYKLNGNIGTQVPADGTVAFYYWSAKTYASLKASGSALTKENADYIKAGADITQTYSSKYGYEYYANSEGIPAKQLGETMYTAAVFTMADGTEYCSGVTVYSAEEYAGGQISKASAAESLKQLVKWMVVYGEEAYAYFNG